MHPHGPGEGRTVRTQPGKGSEPRPRDWKPEKNQDEAEVKSRRWKRRKECQFYEQKKGYANAGSLGQKAKTCEGLVGSTGLVRAGSRARPSCRHAAPRKVAEDGAGGGPQPSGRPLLRLRGEALPPARRLEPHCPAAHLTARWGWRWKGVTALMAAKPAAELILFSVPVKRPRLSSDMQQAGFLSKAPPYAIFLHLKQSTEQGPGMSTSQGWRKGKGMEVLSRRGRARNRVSCDEGAIHLQRLKEEVY